MFTGRPSRPQSHPQHAHPLNVIRPIPIPPRRLRMARHIPKPIRRRPMYRRRHPTRLLTGGIPSLAILGIRGLVRAVRRVALAQLARVRVHRQGVGIVNRLDGVAAAEQRAEFGAVAGRVVVGGRGAEALLLFAVAAEGELGEGGEDEEEAGRGAVLVTGDSLRRGLRMWLT